MTPNPFAWSGESVRHITSDFMRSCSRRAWATSRCALAAFLFASAMFLSAARASLVSVPIFTSDWRLRSASADWTFDWKTNSSPRPITRRLNPSLVQIGHYPFFLISTTSSCPPTITRINAAASQSVQEISGITSFDWNQKWKDADRSYALAVRGERIRLMNRLACVLVPFVWFTGYFVWLRVRDRLARR